MPRPISWQRELGAIHRRVTDSPRSPYGREDLERLFGIGERAARQLMELMPRSIMANLQVVEREVLLEFLAGCLDAEDLAAHLQQLRLDPPKPSRRKLKLAIPREFEPGNVRSLERWNVWLERGKAEIHFTTLADFTSKLWQLIQVVDDPAFEKRFCEPERAAEPTAEQLLEQQDRRRVLAESRLMNKMSALREAKSQHDLLTEEGLHEQAGTLASATNSIRIDAMQALSQLRSLETETSDFVRQAEVELSGSLTTCLR